MKSTTSIYPHNTPLAHIPPRFRGISWDQWADLVLFTPENHVPLREGALPVTGTRDTYGMRGPVAYRNNTRSAEPASPARLFA